MGALVNIASGSIEENIRYKVAGSGTVTYNSIVYNVNDTFLGIVGITTYTTSGSPNVYQDLYALGLEPEIVQTGLSLPVATFLKGLFTDSFYANGLEQEFNAGNVLPSPAFLKGTFSDRFFAFGLSIEFTPTVLTIRNSPIAMWF